MLQRISCPSDDDYELWLELLQLGASPELLDGLGDFLADYLLSSGLKTYVIGLSGGIDSSFLAALLYSRKIPFLGFCLPIDSNTQDEIDRGTQIAHAYCCPPAGITYAQVHDFTDLYQRISTRFANVLANTSPLAEGNIKARIRMIFLYHVAQVHGGCVLSTDQLDELLTGFWTLHGDVGDVSPLQLIPKSVEYDLAHLLCDRLEDPKPLKAAIRAIPTDGLGISSSDLDQLGVDSYATVEDMFREFFSLRLRAQNSVLSEDDKRLMEHLEQQGPVQRFLKSGFKRAGAVLVDPRGALERVP